MDVIFEGKERTRTAPKRPGKGDYAFYDSSAHPNSKPNAICSMAGSPNCPSPIAPKPLRDFRRAPPAVPGGSCGAHHPAA